jgi:hypothetical protein
MFIVSDGRDGRGAVRDGGDRAGRDGVRGGGRDGVHGDDHGGREDDGVEVWNAGNVTGVASAEVHIRKDENLHEQIKLFLEESKEIWNNLSYLEDGVRGGGGDGGGPCYKRQNFE